MKSVLKQLNVKGDFEQYTLNNYMVTNKVYYSDLKRINFDIITFYELKKML